MKIERSKPTVFIHNNSIYALGGMSPNQSYFENLCEKYDEQKDCWETVTYDGFGVPFVSGAAVLNSPRDKECSNVLLVGGSDLSYITKMVQSMTINEKKKEFDFSSLGNAQSL